MQKRTKERLAQHTAEGHILMWDEGPRAKEYYGFILCVCSCTWMGWLEL